MADIKGKDNAAAKYAKRIDPGTDNLTREQQQFIRQAELAQWRQRSQKLRSRNLITGLAIGAIVIGIYGYTIRSVTQERIMDKLDEEATMAARTRNSKTEAN